jgi:hypothetical protein
LDLTENLIVNGTQLVSKNLLETNLK